MLERAHPDRRHPRRGSRAAEPLLGKLIFLLSVSGAGCDVGRPVVDASRGPDLQIVATFPADGAGTDCDPTSADDCGVARDTPIELRFDRPLLPSTAVRQSLVVYSGDPDRGLFLEPEYDVIERVVTYRLSPGGLLEPGLLYTVDVVVPRDDGGDGFRAFDGAPLASDGSPPSFEFRTARAVPPPAPEASSTPTCGDFLSVLEASGCPSCHAGGGDAPHGLELDSAEGVSQTAIRRVARQTDTGSTVGRPLENPSRFGVAMPIIAPGSPSRSYLVYKLLQNPRNFGPEDEACATRHLVSLPDGQCLPLPDDELDRLREWFVRLDPMPAGDWQVRPIDDLRTITAFITHGAPCP